MALEQNLETARNRLEALPDFPRKPKLPTTNSAVSREAAGLIAPILAGLGSAQTAVTSLAAIADKLTTSYNVRGFAMAPIETQIFVALAGALLARQPDLEVVVPSIVPATATKAVLDTARNLVRAASELDILANGKATIASAAVSADSPLALEFKAAIEAARAACVAVGAFMTGLAKAPADAGGSESRLARVVREVGTARLMSRPNTLLILVTTDRQDGGAYGRDGLRNLGHLTMPHWVAGSAIVSYVLMRPDGRLLGSGIVPVHSGYQKLQEAEGTARRHIANRWRRGR
jgi:hypothetical protein